MPSHVISQRRKSPSLTCVFWLVSVGHWLMHGFLEVSDLVRASDDCWSAQLSSDIICGIQVLYEVLSLRRFLSQINGGFEHLSSHVPHNKRLFQDDCCWSTLSALLFPFPVSFPQSPYYNSLLIKCPPYTEQSDITDFLKIRPHFSSSLLSSVVSSIYRYAIQILQLHLPVLSSLFCFFTKVRPHLLTYHSLKYIPTALPLCLSSSHSFALSPSSPFSAFWNWIQILRIGLNDTC